MAKASAEQDEEGREGCWDGSVRAQERGEEEAGYHRDRDGADRSREGQVARVGPRCVRALVGGCFALLRHTGGFAETITPPHPSSDLSRITRCRADATAAPRIGPAQ